MVVDETMAECDPAAAEAIWEHAGLAIPLQINFALSGAARLIREIRAALHRREREQTLARRAAAAAIETELKTTVAGLLLHSQLALSGSEIPPPVAEKLRVVADLAGSLRQQLNAPLPVRGRHGRLSVFRPRFVSMRIARPSQQPSRSALPRRLSRQALLRVSGRTPHAHGVS